MYMKKKKMHVLIKSYLPSGTFRSSMSSIIVVARSSTAVSITATIAWEMTAFAAREASQVRIGRHSSATTTTAAAAASSATATSHSWLSPTHAHSLPAYCSTVHFGDRFFGRIALLEHNESETWWIPSEPNLLKE